MTKKKTIIEDVEDMKMLAAYKRGEFKPVKNQRAMLAMAQQAAVNYKKSKAARINIRLTEGDLDELKLRAEEEGIPYQTLIASVLHKYINGRLVSKGA